MERVFAVLSLIEDWRELQLTVLVFAKVLANQNQWTDISRKELIVATGFSAAAVSRSITKMLQRGYVSRIALDDQPGEFAYRIRCAKLALSENYPPNPDQKGASTFLGSAARSDRRTLEHYFINTGFFDQLSLARKIAQEQNFGEDEMIEAICKVADKNKEYPPVTNKTAWFAKVYNEKLREARADILAHRQGHRYR